MAKPTQQNAGAVMSIELIVELGVGPKPSFRTMARSSSEACWQGFAVPSSEY